LPALKYTAILNRLIPDDSMRACLQWLRASFQATGCEGSSHSYSPLFGWARAYPETTGYLIETLLKASRLPGEGDLAEYAIGALNWLCTVQLPNGAFTALTAEHRVPSVFNTAQVLFGFAFVLSSEDVGTADDRDRWALAGSRALDWLSGQLDEPVGWGSGAYVSGYDPTYYTRALWGMLCMDEVLYGGSPLRGRVEQALERYARRFRPNGALDGWGFWPNKPAHTHTIAYALEGFWHTARMLNRADIAFRAETTLRRLLRQRAADGRTAGAYDSDWRGVLHYRCVTGNVQLSLLAAQMAGAGDAAQWSAAAVSLFSEVANAQSFAPCKGMFGGLPGSAPLWGPYLRMRFPNWAARFYAEAWMLIHAWAPGGTPPVCGVHPPGPG
jgi:hypothetical protein